MSNKAICYGDIVYIQCGELILMANGQYSPLLHLNSTENIALKSFRNGLFMLYPNLSYKDTSHVEKLEHQLDLLVSLNPEETYAAQQLQEDIKKEKLILEDREAKLVTLNDKVFHESKGQPIKYNQKIQLLHLESQTFVGLSNLYDNSMNHLELAKEGSKDLYFEFILPKSAETKERQVLNYETPVLLVSSKSQAGLKQGAEIDKNTLKIELNPETNKICNSGDDYPAIPPRRREPIYQTDKIYSTGVSEDANGEIQIKRFLSFEDYAKAEAKNYLKNGDYIRIANDELYLYAIQKRGGQPTGTFFQSLNKNQDYKYSNIYTLFQILDVTEITNEDGSKDPFNPSVLPQGNLIESNENNRFLLKHVISGTYFTSKENCVILTEVSDLSNLPKISLAVSGESNEFIDSNTTLQIKLEQESLQLGELIKIPNVQLEVNTFYFFGFFNPDNYLNKVLKPTRFKTAFSPSPDFKKSSFTLRRIDDEEAASIQLAESLANEAQRFIDFIVEFFNGNPQNFDEFNNNIQKLSTACAQYTSEMYNGNFNESEDHSLVPNPLRQTLLREFRVYNLLYPILRCLIQTEGYKEKVEKDSGDRESKNDEIVTISKINSEGFEQLIKNIKTLILSSFRANDLNHYYCSQFVRVPINCLIKDKTGLTAFITDRDRKQIKSYMLELCIEGLWETDLDAIGQLNFYESELFGALESQKTFHTYYMQLMKYISNIKIHNLKILIRDNMVFNYLNNDDNMSHVFPKLYEEDGKMYLAFKRKKHKEICIRFALAGDLVPATPKDLQINFSEEVEALVNYFQESLNLIFALNNIDSSVFKLKIMRYYTYNNLVKADQILQVSSRFRELRVLMSDLISIMHKNYFSVPLLKLPTQLVILDQDPSSQQKIHQTNTFMLDTIKAGIATFKEKYLQKENQGLFDNATDAIGQEEKHQDRLELLQKANLNIEALDNSRILVEEIKKFLESHVELPLEFLRTARHILVSLIDQARTKGGKIFIDFIKQALEVLGEMDEKTVIYTALEITGELKKQPLSSPSLDTQEKLLSRKVTPIEASQKERSYRVDLALNTVATSVLAVLARKWKTGERLHHENVPTQNQTSKSYTLLLDIILLNQQHLMSDVIQQMKNLSSFESSLYRELDKLSIHRDSGCLPQVQESLKISFRLDEIAREINFCKDEQIPIEKEKLDEFLKEVLEAVWELFFMLYDTSKHFRYPDEKYQSSEKRFREAFEDYKKPRWDKLLALNPQAINKPIQKIFNVLKIYDSVSKNQTWVLDKKSGFGEEFRIHSDIMRLTPILLCAFVQNNKENQLLFSQNGAIMRRFYSQSFLNQSPDTMLIFVEMMRGNKKLLNSPSRSICAVSAATFLGTMGRLITNSETNAYLCAGIMGLAFITKVNIPIENADPVKLLKTKFSEATVCDSFTSLDILASQEEAFDQPYCYYSMRALYSVFLEVHEHLIVKLNATKELQTILLFNTFPPGFLQEKYKKKAKARGWMGGAQAMVKVWGSGAFRAGLMGSVFFLAKIPKESLAEKAFLIMGCRRESVKEWFGIFESKNFLLQYELKNLVAKCFILNYFQTFNKNFTIIQDATECFKMISTLLADILYFMAKKNKQNTLELSKLLENADVVLNNDSYKKVSDAYKEAKELDLATRKVRIALDDIPLENLLIEYIYEGCIDLLFNILLQYPKFLPSSLIPFIFKLISEFIESEWNNKNFPAQKIQDFLSQASNIQEYQKNRSTIIQILKKLTHRRTDENKLEQAIIKDAYQTYNDYITHLYSSKRKSKDQNLKEIAECITQHPNAKDILTQIISHLKRRLKNLDQEELIFCLKILRKCIEIENTNNLDEEPIYSWKEVTYVDLKKIERVQNLYRTLGLSSLLFTLLSRNETKIFRETLLLSLAYMYGGNLDIQTDFYENFKNDDKNYVIQKIKEKLEFSWYFFQSKEQERVDTLYSVAQKTLFKYFTVHKFDQQVNHKSVETAVSGMNLDKTTVEPAENQDLNEQFLLILTFLQFLSEKQFSPMQNFLREQKVDDHQLKNSFDILSFLRQAVNSYYKILNRYNLSVGNKILDLIIELIQGEAHENITLLLNKTFVHDLCRILTDYNSKYHTLPRGFGLNIFHDNFREFKSKVILIFKIMLENRNEAILEVLTQHLDIPGLVNTLLGLMNDFVTKNNLQKKIFSSVELSFFLKNEDFNDTLGDAINIYIIFRYLWEDPNVFNENLREQIKLLSKSDQDFVSKIVFQIFRNLVRSIEINVEKKDSPLTRIWFPMIAMCYYLQEDAKEAFKKYVDRSSTQTKIAALVDSTQEFLPQMEADYNVRTGSIKFNLTTFYRTIRLVTNAIALFITFFNVGTYTYDFGAEEPQQEDKYKTTTKVLNAVQIALAALLILYWIPLFSKRTRTVKWEKYIDKNVKTQGFLPPTLKTKLENGDYKDLTPEECKTIMKLKGANSDEFKEMQKLSTNFQQIASTYLTLQIWFTINSKVLLWHLIYLGITIGSIFHPLVAIFQIFDIAIRADTITQIYASISRNVFQFLWTLFLLVITCVIYAFIGFFFLSDQFNTSDNALCETAFSCFLNVLNLGLRSGGGIADVIGSQAYSHEHIGLFIARVIFDLSFFIIMIILLLNLIFGMIIDAFGDLRDQKTSNDEDEKNVCFICGIERSEFERYTNFEEHIERDHNLWSYVYYLVYLVEKRKVSKTEMTDIEHSVIEKYLARNCNWIPVGKSITLETIYEKEKLNQEDDIQQISKKIDLMQADVTALNKQITNSQSGPDLKPSGILESSKNSNNPQVNQKLHELSRRVEDIQKFNTSMFSELKSSIEKLNNKGEAK